MASADLLWKYIRDDLSQWRLSPAASVLEKAIEDGRTVVLFDGLDEVPADDEARLTLVKVSLQRFVERYKNNRHLITCRVLSYQEPHWRLPKAFPDLELARFDEDQIDRFIAAWYREVGAKWRLPPSEIETLSDKLRRAVRRRDLWRLAPNPLLLTVMACRGSPRAAGRFLGLRSVGRALRVSRQVSSRLLQHRERFSDGVVLGGF